MVTGSISEERIAGMHGVLAGYVERGEVSGLVAAVGGPDEAHIESMGALERDGCAPMRRDTIFRISSMSKPITAAAAMILVDEGKLKLEEPVDALLPELAERMVLKRIESPLDDVVPARRPVTVRDLLTFSMGTGIVMAMPGTFPIQRAMDELHLGQGPPDPDIFPPPDEWIRRLGTLPLIHQPGEQWMYNTGSDVLGVLIARASGKRFDSFLRERLFIPLGMKDTDFSVPPEKIDRLPTEYWTNASTGAVEVYDVAQGGKWSRPPAFFSGGAGLVSTADDFLSFARMLLRHGEHSGTQVLSKASVQAMTTDQLTPQQKAASDFPSGFFEDHGWGYGLSVVTKKKGESAPWSVGTYGWDGGLGTSWYTYPNEEMVTILLTQRMWSSPVAPALFHDFWRSANGAPASQSAN